VESHFAEDVSRTLFAFICRELQSYFVLAVGRRQRNVLVPDSKAALVIDLELKFIVFEVIMSPIPALGADIILIFLAHFEIFVLLLIIWSS